MHPMIEAIAIWSAVLICFALVCALGWFAWRRWFAAKLSPEDLPYVFPGLPAGKWAETSFGKIHYIDIGSGPCILLVHGLGASVYCWRPLISLLAPKYRVVALDLPGFGLSEKRVNLDYGLDAQVERLEEFINVVKLPEVNIVGSSMGGLLALWLALKAPEKVKRVIGLAPALHHRIFPFNPSPLGLFSNWYSSQLNETWIRRILSRVLVTHESVEDDAVKAYLYPYHQQPDAIKIFVKAVSTVRDRRIPKNLIGIKTPVIILHGELDQVVPVKISKGALKYLSTATLKILPNAGHHLQEDNPQWVFEKIDSFCTSPGSRSSYVEKS